MALFTKAPEKTVTRDRDAAKANVDRLAAKLIEAERFTIATRNAAQAVAMTTDDAALDIAEAAGAAALRREDTIRAASGEAGKLLAALEAQLAILTDQKQRAATVAEVTALADDLMQAGESFEIAISELVKATEKAARFVYEAKALETFAASSQVEIPEAVGVIGELVRAHAEMVLSGLAPATLPAKEAPFVPNIAVKPETRHLFTLRGISWREGDQLRVAQKFTDVDLPLAAAKRALKARACCEISDPMRNPQTVNQWGGHPNPESCFSLEDDVPVTDATEPREVVQHSAFTRVDRGPSYVLRVASGGVS
jgi:hypothetical protein